MFLRSCWRKKLEVSDIRKLYNNKDKLHNFSHILRIKKYADFIKKNYKVHEGLLRFILLFHGAKDYVIKNKEKFDSDYVKSLLRHNKNPIKIEEKIVHDANALDNIGNEGIKKALYAGKLKGRSIEKTKNYVRSELKKLKFYTKQGKEMSKNKIEVIKEWLRRR